MQKAPIYPEEDNRIKALIETGLIDTPPEERFDKITKEVKKTFNVPISTISLIDKDREFFKSHQGIEADSGPRDISFCGHAMMADYVFIVEDTSKDERFFDNPYVIRPPFVRFYAGVILRKNKLPIGVLCVKDTKPRKFSSEDISKLISFGQLVEKEINITK